MLLRSIINYVPLHPLLAHDETESNMPRDLMKTFSYLTIHLAVGFSVAYVLIGSLMLAGGIALIEPCINAMAFYVHEKAWKRAEKRGKATPAGNDGFDQHMLKPA